MVCGMVNVASLVGCGMVTVAICGVNGDCSNRWCHWWCLV